MKVAELIKVLETMDQDAMAVVFSNGEFHIPVIKEYNCNCGSQPKIYYIGPKEKEPVEKKKFEI